MSRVEKDNEFVQDYNDVTSNIGNSKQNTVTAKPFIKWAGGKSALLNRINKFYPKALESDSCKYCEPFLGGGAVLFDLLSNYSLSDVYVSDMNMQLINLYLSVKNDVNELIEYLEAIESDYIIRPDEERKSYFYKKRAEYNEYIVTNNPVVYGSALFIFLNRTCFNGLYRVNSKGLFNVPSGVYKNPKICDRNNLLHASALLQNVDIVHGSFENSYNFIDSDSFVYLDPPYRPITGTSSFTSYTKGNFNDDEQIRLAEYVRSIDKKGAKFVLSNSDPKNVNPNDDFFDELYSNFNIYRILSDRRINSKGSARGKITELLITNIKE